MTALHIMAVKGEEKSRWCLRVIISVKCKNLPVMDWTRHDQLLYYLSPNLLSFGELQRLVRPSPTQVLLMPKFLAVSESLYLWTLCVFVCSARTTKRGREWFLEKSGLGKFWPDIFRWILKSRFWVILRLGASNCLKSRSRILKPGSCSLAKSRIYHSNTPNKVKGTCTIVEKWLATNKILAGRIFIFIRLLS